MKISKLFHSLYACLMLAPVVAVGVSCATTFFNKEVKGSYDIQTIQYQYQTNNISTASEMIIGNAYTIDDVGSKETLNFPLHELFYVNGSAQIYMKILGGYINFNDTENLYVDEFCANVNENLDLTYIVLEFQCYIVENETLYDMYLYSPCYSDNGEFYAAIITANSFSEEDFDNFIYDINIDFVFLDCSDNYEFEENGVIKKCANRYNPIISVNTTHYNTSLNNVFYESLDSVKTSPYFSWAYNSFLVAPFAYLCNLFSMPTNHIVLMYLSYWLTISVIWLVFDIVMWLPNLAHKYIDKGSID